jgi:HAE1 family hydrophobic/amphiphilic exporter-1
MPIGFMGGIIGKFFHEFGITIVAAVMISMFVSFTLDPMLSSIWHDPSIHAHGQKTVTPVTLYDKTIGRVTGWFDRMPPMRWPRATSGILRWSLVHKLARPWPLPLAHLCAECGHGAACLGTEFVPKADFSETMPQLLHPRGLIASKPPRCQGQTGGRP